MSIHIREISINELRSAIGILNHIPEFDSLFYAVQIERRLKKYDSVILIAEFAGKQIGCIIAYNRYFDGSIYLSLGGVLVPFRSQGVAKELQKKLEEEATKRFFHSIRLKTRNKHYKTLNFAIKNGYQIIDFKMNSEIGESQIELLKKI